MLASRFISRPTQLIRLLHNMQTLAPNTPKLAYRDNSLFTDSHDHEHETDHEADHDTNTNEHNSAIDPHGWLDPSNAIYWVELIAEQLTALDSKNANNYRSNAAATKTATKTAATQGSPTTGVIIGQTLCRLP